MTPSKRFELFPATAATTEATPTPDEGNRMEETFGSTLGGPTMTKTGATPFDLGVKAPFSFGRTMAPSTPVPASADGSRASVLPNFGATSFDVGAKAPFSFGTTIPSTPIPESVGSSGAFVPPTTAPPTLPVPVSRSASWRSQLRKDHKVAKSLGVDVHAYRATQGRGRKKGERHSYQSKYGKARYNARKLGMSTADYKKELERIGKHNDLSVKEVNGLMTESLPGLIHKGEQTNMPHKGVIPISVNEIGNIVSQEPSSGPSLEASGLTTPGVPSTPKFVVSALTAKGFSSEALGTLTQEQLYTVEENLEDEEADKDLVSMLKSCADAQATCAETHRICALRQADISCRMDTILTTMKEVHSRRKERASSLRKLKQSSAKQVISQQVSVDPDHPQLRHNIAVAAEPSAQSPTPSL